MGCKTGITYEQTVVGKGHEIPFRRMQTKDKIYR